MVGGEGGQQALPSLEGAAKNQGCESMSSKGNAQWGHLYDLPPGRDQMSCTGP